MNLTSVDTIHPSIRRAFTLVELLVVITIIGLLSSLILPAIQASREAARRAQCLSNLKNQSMAVVNFELAKGFLPPGRVIDPSLDYSWNFYTLPWIEQSALYNGFDRKKPWNDATHIALTNQVLPIYRCPSGKWERPGDTDYAGLNGSVIGGTHGNSFDRGVMVLVTPDLRPISMSSVTDGSSNTLCISESPDRENNEGLWVHGLNCVSHDSGSINSNIDGITSRHPGGANGARLDGSVSFFTSGIDQETLGALLTRNGGESFSEESL